MYGPRLLENDGKCCILKGGGRGAGSVGSSSDVLLHSSVTKMVQTTENVINTDMKTVHRGETLCPLQHRVG